MTEITALNSNDEKLAFRNSRVRLMGFSDELIHKGKESANNVVGAGNLAGDSFYMAGQLAQGAIDPGFLIGSAINASARLPLMFSDKTKQASIQDKMQQTTSLSTPAQLHRQTLTERLGQKSHKLLDPTRHPVEVSAFLSMLAGTVFLATGIDTLFSAQSGDDNTVGILQLALGVLTIGGRLLEIFSCTPSERMAQQKTEEEKGWADGLWRIVNENPEVTSASIGLASSATALGIGLASGSMLMTIAGGIWIGCCLMYMTFVRRERDQSPDEVQRDIKNERSEQVAVKQKTEKPILGTFTSRLTEERDHKINAIPALS